MKVYSLTQRSNDGNEGSAGVYSSLEKALTAAKVFLARPEASYRWYVYGVSEHEIDAIPLPGYLSAIGTTTVREVAHVEWNRRASGVEITYEANV